MPFRTDLLKKQFEKAEVFAIIEVSITIRRVDITEKEMIQKNIEEFSRLQIKDRHYTQALEGYTGEILLVGINYDRENEKKPHSCVIERMEK